MYGFGFFFLKLNLMLCQSSRIKVTFLQGWILHYDSNKVFIPRWVVIWKSILISPTVYLLVETILPNFFEAQKRPSDGFNWKAET